MMRFRRLWIFAVELRRIPSFWIFLLTAGLFIYITLSSWPIDFKTYYFDAIIAIVLTIQLTYMLIESYRELPSFKAYVPDEKGKSGGNGVWANLTILYCEQIHANAFKFMSPHEKIPYLYGFISLIITNIKAKPTTIRKILVNKHYGGIYVSPGSSEYNKEIIFVQENNIQKPMMVGILRQALPIYLPAYTTISRTLIIPLRDETTGQRGWPSPPDVEIEVTDVFGKITTITVSGLYNPEGKSSEWDILELSVSDQGLIEK